MIPDKNRLPTFKSADQSILDKFNRPFRLEPHIDEFPCPYFPEEEPTAWITIEVCEDKACGKGCKDKEQCIAYNQQKNLQNKHPEINWQEVWKNPPEKISLIKFIKQGVVKNV